jgi:hypothetical protein
MKCCVILGFFSDANLHTSSLELPFARPHRTPTQHHAAPEFDAVRHHAAFDDRFVAWRRIVQFRPPDLACFAYERLAATGRDTLIGGVLIILIDVLSAEALRVQVAIRASSSYWRSIDTPVAAFE